jgi:hypothetical protein
MLRAPRWSREWLGPKTRPSCGGAHATACPHGPSPMTSMKALLAGLSLVALLGWGGCGMGSSKPSSSSKDSNRIPTVSAMWESMAKDGTVGGGQVLAQQRIRRKFSFARSPAEHLPRAVARHLMRTLGAPPNSFAVKAAQNIRSLSASLWIVYGRGRVQGVACLLQGVRGYVGCTSLSDFARRGISIGMAKPSEKAGALPRDFRALGIAPDWVETVQLSVGSEGGQIVPVRGGVYTHHAEAPIFVERFCSRERKVCRSLRPKAPRETKP